MLNAFLRMPKAAMLIFAVAILSLLFVFVLQFIFGVDPCILCLWQRVPYGVAAALALIAWFWQPYSRHTRMLLALCGVSFAIGAGLAFFHTGVEQHWWLGTSGCSIQPLNGATTEDLRTALLHTVVAHCDQISWTFLGLSLANWNLPWSILLSAFSFAASLKMARK